MPIMAFGRGTLREGCTCCRKAAPGSLYTFEVWGKQLLDFMDEVVGESAFLVSNSVGGASPYEVDYGLAADCGLEACVNVHGCELGQVETSSNVHLRARQGWRHWRQQLQARSTCAACL
jgi:hypothetical protein